jgi:hypothetical protein
MRRLVPWLLMLALFLVFSGAGCSPDSKPQPGSPGGAAPVPPKSREQGGRMDGVDKYTPPPGK